MGAKHSASLRATHRLQVDLLLAPLRLRHERVALTRRQPVEPF